MRCCCLLVCGRCNECLMRADGAELSSSSYGKGMDKLVWGLLLFSIPHHRHISEPARTVVWPFTGDVSSDLVCHRWTFWTMTIPRQVLNTDDYVWVIYSSSHPLCIIARILWHPEMRRRALSCANVASTLMNLERRGMASKVTLLRKPWEKTPLLSTLWGDFAA